MPSWRKGSLTNTRVAVRPVKPQATAAYNPMEKCKVCQQPRKKHPNPGIMCEQATAPEPVARLSDAEITEKAFAQALYNYVMEVYRTGGIEALTVAGIAKELTHG